MKHEDSSMKSKDSSTKSEEGDDTEFSKGPNCENCCATVLVWVVRCILVVYDIITFPIYFLIQMPWKRWKADRITWARPTKKDDPYCPWVRVTSGEFEPPVLSSSLHELFKKSVHWYGPKKCLGHRERISEAEEYSKVGKTLKKMNLGEYQWQSYLDVDLRIENLVNGMLDIGVEPKKPVMIFSETRMEWFLVCLACFRLNVPVATLYTTLGDDAIIHGVAETEVTHIFTSQDLLPKLKVACNKISSIAHVIVFENVKHVDTTGFVDSVDIKTFSQLEKIALTSHQITKPEPPEADDLALIMYTSGSTGKPKGVKLTHKNFLSTTAGLKDCIPEIFETDIYIAFLPLAHVLEMASELFFLLIGVPIGYASPWTLFDKGTGLMSGCKSDVSALNPTIMISVPLMLDRIRKDVNDEINKRSAFKRKLFDFALVYRLFWYNRGFGTPIMNRLIFKKVKDGVGKNLRAIVVGGASVSPETQDFIRMCLNIPILQAYGTTETAACGTCMALDDYSTGRVGGPISGCYLKLVDSPEGNFYATDKPNPRGELAIGGDSVSLGYFKNDKLTEEVFKEEDRIQWFYTADIAERFPNGTFKIIDRMKDVVKLQTGEYVALGKIEAELKTCPLVNNICVLGHNLHNYLIALIVPNEKHLTKLAKTLGKENLTMEEMCQDPDVIAAATEEIADRGEKSKLARPEIPTKIKLCTEEWEPETGLVTAAFKVRRKHIQEFYKSAIEELFAFDSE